MYKVPVDRGNSTDQSSVFYNIWETNLNFAFIKKKEEYNTKVNNSWKYVSKNDPRKMWKMMSCDEEILENNDIQIRGKVISNYFTKIFQAERLIEYRRRKLQFKVKK